MGYKVDDYVLKGADVYRIVAVEERSLGSLPPEDYFVLDVAFPSKHKQGMSYIPVSKADMSIRPVPLETEVDKLFDANEPEELSLLTGQQLRAYTEQESDDRFIDVEKQSALSRTDEEARLVMRMLTGCANTSEFQKLPRQDRDGFFRQLYQKGINIAQIGRITGYSRPLVYRALEA